MWIQETGGIGAEMEKTLHAKATGERKEQHYQLFPAEKKKNSERKPIVFTKAVFLELSTVWCLYTTEGLLLIIHHGCWKPPPSHLINIGNQQKSRLRKHITCYETHESQNDIPLEKCVTWLLHLNNHMF